MEDTNNQENIELKNRLLGLTSEVGGGIATDYLSSGLLALGPLGWLGYGAINFGQGAYTNYLVQKHIYGNEKINWGEVWSSGGMGVIPFTQIGASAKAAKYVGAAGSVKRGIVSGAGVGLAGEQLRVGIDEKRWLNPLEASVSAGIGGALGGGLHALKDPGQPLQEYAAKRVYQQAGGQPVNTELLKGKIVAQINMPGQPTSGISPYPTTRLSSPYKDWTAFGYQKPARTLPTQVRKVLGTDLQDEVAGSLWNFYARANTYHKKHGSFRGFGEKFVNPANGKVYYVQKTRTKNPRLTLQSQEKKTETVRRRNRKDKTSSSVQKLLRDVKKLDIAKLNKVEGEKFDEAVNELTRRIQISSRDIHRYNQYPDIQESIAAQIAEDGKLLDKITEGYYYGEHGHALRSKVWDHVRRVKRFANQDLKFEAGDGKNFHLVFESNKANQQFKKLKDDFELIIEGVIGKNQLRYPDIIVNYNPVLSGPGKKIRFERLSTLKLGFKSRQGKLYPDMMHGNLIAEYDVDLLGIPTPAQLQKWLDKNLPGEKVSIRKPKVQAGFKKTKLTVPKIEDLELKQSTKKKYIKKRK